MEDQVQYKTEEKYKDYDPFLALKCKKCGEDIPSQNVNINKTLAKCDSCGSMFTFEDDVFFENKRGRPEFIMPEGIEVLKLLTSMEMEMSWFRSMKRSNLAFEIMFTVLWNVIVLGMVAAMVAGGAVINLIFLAIHLLVGLTLGYRLLAKFINKTNIIIDDTTIKLEHGPLKMTGKRDLIIENKNVEQLYVSEYVTNVQKNGQPVRAFGLYLILKNRKKIQLVKDSNKESALYLEQEIERYLKIEDRSVRGEVIA